MHPLDIDIKRDFKAQLTSQHDRPVYSQNFWTPTNLKDDLLVKLPLVKEYGTITTLLYGQYLSSIFAQCNLNGKLKILVDSRPMKHLMKYENGEPKQLVTRISDAAHHMTGKYFHKTRLLSSVSLCTDGR